MRKLIWCAAAGAVAAGSAWATVYAWNHQHALARGSLGSSCMVSLVNKAHVATPTTPSSPSDDAAAPLWTKAPSGRPTDVPPEHELKLNMPIVIREPDDVAGKGGTEEGKALDNLNNGYEDERLAILEQLRPLMSDIVNAEIVAGSAKTTDDTVCPQPMPYCTDDEDDEINVTGSAPVMPYAKEESVSKAAVMAVGELLWTVPFLGEVETGAELSVRLDVEKEFPYPLQDCQPKPPVADAEPSPEELEAVELAIEIIKESVSPSLHIWGFTFDVTSEMPDGTEESEPKSPEEESYHYHDHDLSCPYSGCPYPGAYRNMPEPPAEEPEPKKAGEKAPEPEKATRVLESIYNLLNQGDVLPDAGVIPPGFENIYHGGLDSDASLQERIRAAKAKDDGDESWLLSLVHQVQAMASQAPTPEPQYGFATATGYSPPDNPTPLPAGSTPPEDGGFYTNMGILLYRPTNVNQKPQDLLHAKEVQDTALSVAETVALAVAESKVLAYGDLSLSSLVHRAKEMLSDYVHMVTDDRGAYCEDPVVMPPDLPETKEPMKATTDTLEFRLSDHAPYEDDDDTGPF